MLEAVHLSGLPGTPGRPEEAATTMAWTVRHSYSKPAAPTNGAAGLSSLVGDVFIMPVVGNARGVVVSSNARAWACLDLKHSRLYSGCVGRIRAYEIGSLVLVFDRSGSQEEYAWPCDWQIFHVDLKVGSLDVLESDAGGSQQ